MRTSATGETGTVVLGFERIVTELNPLLVIVAGNSHPTLGCALTAAKCGVAVATLEAGLRSWDWSSSREVNRVVTDRLADSLFTHGEEASGNLRSEGVPEGRIHPTGSTAVDTLRAMEPAARARRAWEQLGCEPHEYVLMTFHHAANIADTARLESILAGIRQVARHARVVFPLHPITRDRLEQDGLLSALDIENVVFTPPLGYIDFLSLQVGAGVVVTDSTGVQEETTALGVACRTLHTSTERTVTLSHGTNSLLGDDPAESPGSGRWDTRHTVRDPALGRSSRRAGCGRDHRELLPQHRREAGGLAWDTAAARLLLRGASLTTARAARGMGAVSPRLGHVR